MDIKPNLCLSNQFYSNFNRFIITQTSGASIQGSGREGWRYECVLPFYESNFFHFHAVFFKKCLPNDRLSHLRPLCAILDSMKVTHPFPGAAYLRISSTANIFFLKNVRWTHVLLWSHVYPCFATSGFQSQSGQPYSHFAEAFMMYIS